MITYEIDGNIIKITKITEDLGKTPMRFSLNNTYCEERYDQDTKYVLCSKDVMETKCSYKCKRSGDQFSHNQWFDCNPKDDKDGECIDAKGIWIVSDVMPTSI